MIENEVEIEKVSVKVKVKEKKVGDGKEGVRENATRQTHLTNVLSCLEMAP